MRTAIILAGLLIRDGLTERSFPEFVAKILAWLVTFALIMDISDFARKK